MNLQSPIACLVALTAALAAAPVPPALAETLDEQLLRQRAGESKTYTDEMWELLAKGTSPNVPDRGGRTAVHAAARNGAVETLQALLQAGGDPNVADEDGNTPLHFAADTSRSPLTVAESISAIRVLLRAGANAGRANANGRTALHLAAGSHDLPAGVAALARAGADPNRKDRDGATPLHAALDTRGWPGVVGTLLDGAADPRVENGAGLTALQLFVRTGPDQGDTAAILIDAGADPDRAYPNGDAPLHVTIRSGGSRGKVEVADALLSGGADPCVRDARRFTPYNIAREGGAIHRALDRAGGHDLACDGKEEQRIAGSDDGTDRESEAGPGEALEPKCPNLLPNGQCWEEIADRPGCYMWGKPSSGRTLSWSGRCSGGVAEGEGIAGVRLRDGTVLQMRGSISGGRLDGEPTVVSAPWLTGSKADQDEEPRAPQQQVQEPQAPEKPPSRRVTLEEFPLSCPSFPVIGPGMKVGTRTFTEVNFTFEIPGQEYACWNTAHSLFAVCQEANCCVKRGEWVECDENAISQQDRGQCVAHFRQEAERKCGPDPYR